MPRRCSVSGCRGNYDGEPLVTTFSIPKDPAKRIKWIRAIPTKLDNVKNPAVCINHFEEQDIIRVDRVMYKGELKEYPRVIPKLRDNAIPRIFPNLPGYLSNPAPQVRRLDSVEQDQMDEAICARVKEYSDYVLNDTIQNIDDIVWYLMTKETTLEEQRWTYFVKKDKLILCLMDYDSCYPVVLGCIVVENNLDFGVFVDKVKIARNVLPKTGEKLTSFNFLDELLSMLQSNELKTADEKSALDNAVAAVKSLPSYEENEVLQFIGEQLLLSSIPKNVRRFGNQTMLLACCLYTHSPSAYKALLCSGLMYLPHPRNLTKLISNYQLTSSAFSSSAPYLERRLKQLKEHKLLVNLLMDEIYIQPQMSFKGGEMYGSSAFNVAALAKTAQVFMITSVLSNYKDVVAIVQLTT